MQRLLILIAITAMFYPVSASAITGLGFGGKIGHAKYTGDVLPV